LKFNEKELSKIATVCIPDKEGLVEKKGPGKGQGYKPRWLRLKGNLLFYFKLLESGDVDSNGPAGLLILESCCPERTHKDDKPFAFTISFTNDKSRVYKFSAHSEQDANSWVEVLRNASYEQLRMRVYHLQKEISKRTGMVCVVCVLCSRSFLCAYRCIYLRVTVHCTAFSVFVYT
jgi:hypothetical protein